MGIIILFFLKPDFRKFPVEIINSNGFELIWLDGWLNWDLNNISRLGSKPKSLQTHRNLFGNAQNHPPKNPKNVIFFENRCFVQNGFLKSRPHMAAQADPQSGKCSYIDPLSFILSSIRDQNIAFYLKCLISTPVFSGKALFHLEPSLIYFLKNIQPFVADST